MYISVHVFIYLMYLLLWLEDICKLQLTLSLQ